jgi:hypothetical protein
MDKSNLDLESANYVILILPFGKDKYSGKQLRCSAICTQLTTVIYWLLEIASTDSEQNDTFVHAAIDTYHAHAEPVIVLGRELVSRCPGQDRPPCPNRC